MMLTVAAFLLSLASAPHDDPKFTWHDDLTAACARASRENKLILLRQAICSCEKEKCPLAAATRKPDFLEDDSVLTLVSQRFVLATAHAPFKRENDGLHHPDYAPADYSRTSDRVRTLILTPTRHILHRLDLCPYSYDVRSELAFALRVRRECYSPLWVPRNDADEKIYGMHLEHARDPLTAHKSLAGGTGAPEWGNDLSAARRAAKKNGKLLLYFQIAGDLTQDC